MNKSTKIIASLLLILLATGLFLFLFLIKPFFDTQKQIPDKRLGIPNEEISLESAYNDFSAGYPEKSLGKVNQFLDENPGDTEATIVKAKILSNIGSMKFDEEKYAGQSILLLDQILADDPNNVEALYAKGYTLEIQNKFEEALVIYQKALSLLPENEVILNQIGHVYDLMGNKEMAMDFYQRSYSIDSNFSKVLMNMARHYAIDGENEKAIEYFEKITTVSDDFRSLSGAYHGLGNLYFEKDINQALEYMKKSYTHNPNDPNTMIGLAWTQYKIEIDNTIKIGVNYNEETIQRSFDLVEKAIEIHPEQSYGYLTLARMYGYAFPSADEVTIMNYQKAIELIDSDVTILGTQKESYKDGIISEFNAFKELIGYQVSYTQPLSQKIGIKILSYILQPEMVYAGTEYYTSVEDAQARIDSFAGTNHHWTYVGNNTWYCDNGNWMEVVTPPPPPPVNGSCGSSNGRYYPSPSNITNRCASGDSTSITTRGDGTFSWVCQGRHRGSDSGTCSTIGDPFVPITPPGGGGGGGTTDPDGNDDWLSCQFNNNTRSDLDNSRVGDQISVQSLVDDSSGSLDPLGYNFAYEKGGIFLPNNGIVFSPNPDGSYRSDAIIRGPLNDYGAYQIESSFQYFGQLIDIDMCMGNFDDLFAPLNIPEISFSIDPELANEDNECVAEIEVKAIDSDGRATEPVACSIVTSEGDVVNVDSDLINGFNDGKNVTAGASYKLKCEISNPVYGPALNASGRFDDLLQTSIDRCVVNPNLRQN